MSKKIFLLETVLNILEKKDLQFQKAHEVMKSDKYVTVSFFI